MARRVIEDFEQVTYDSNGNAVVTTKKKVFTHKTTTENFYMTYVNYVGWMYNLKGGITSKILLYFMENATINTGRVQLTAGQREVIMESLGISRSAFSKALKELISVKAIREVKRVNKETGEEKVVKGEYFINPKMLWKGDKEVRDRLIVIFESMTEDEFNEELGEDSFKVITTTVVDEIKTDEEEPGEN